MPAKALDPRLRFVPAAVLAGLVAFSVGLTAWAVLALDGLFVGLLLAAAAGWGAFPAAFFLRSPKFSARLVLLSIALGLGILSAVTLAMGCAGMLSAATARALLIIGMSLGAVFAARHRNRAAAEATPASAPQQPLSLLWRTLLLATLAPMLTIGLFTALLPPGILWPDEAGGYDAREYHLQCPREYFEAGRILFLEHNVYASFPQQMEMQYLLLMHLCGGPYAGAVPAQLLHLACGVLAALAIAAWSPPGRSREFAFLLAAGVPWVAYLGCLAYVECGLLLFAASAGGLAAAALRERDHDWRRWLAIGLLAGLAGGCKYTALALVAAPLSLVVPLFLRCAGRVKLRAVFAAGVGAAVAFAPWAVRNIAFTGNPVFPFATALFGGRAWSEDQARQWRAGHEPRLVRPDIGGRLAVAAAELAGPYDAQRRTWVPSYFGFALLPIGVIAACVASPIRVAMLAWIACMLAVWIGMTHIPGRFILPIIVPLSLLTAQGVCVAPRVGAWLIGPALFVGTVLNAALLWNQYVGFRMRWEDRTNIALGDVLGQTEAIRQTHLLNDETLIPPGALVWQVGDAAAFYVRSPMHYTVAFNRDPWIEMAGTAASPRDVVDWLRHRGVAFVAFDWNEIERLRATYGFAEVVTPEWVDSLAPAGLTRVARTGAGGRLEVFRVGPVSP